MRRAARRDQTESTIVHALRATGCSVAYWGIDGAPDLVVGHLGRTFLLEVKQPPGPKGGASADGQKLGELQLVWHAAWRGHVAVVRSVQEALDLVGSLL